MKYIILALMLSGCAIHPELPCYEQTVRANHCGYEHFVQSGTYRDEHGIEKEFCCPIERFQ
jgi:hypothetical protein